MIIGCFLSSKKISLNAFVIGKVWWFTCLSIFLGYFFYTSKPPNKENGSSNLERMMSTFFLPQWIGIWKRQRVNDSNGKWGIPLEKYPKFVPPRICYIWVCRAYGRTLFCCFGLLYPTIPPYPNHTLTYLPYLQCYLPSLLTTLQRKLNLGGFLWNLCPNRRQEASAVS